MQHNLEVPIAFLCGAISHFYGDRLVAIALLGPFAECELQTDSKLEVLILARTLPPTSASRLIEYEALESGLTEWYRGRVAPILLLPLELPGYRPVLDIKKDEMLVLWDDGTLKAFLEE